MTDDRVSQLLPGFVDHHCHFRAWAAQRTQLDLGGATAAQDVFDLIASRTGDWLLGRGLTDDVIRSIATQPHGRLDAAANARPMALISRDGHALVTTHATLLELGLGLDELDVSGGVIERTPDGDWTGVLRERSAWIVRAALPQRVSGDALRDAVTLATTRGVTGLHDMDGLAALSAWAQLHDTDHALDARVTVHLQADDLDDIEHARSLQRGDLLRIGGLKLFADGTLGSGTALLHEPEIPLSPEFPPRVGVEIVGTHELESYARRAAQLGLPLLVHAIGDRAVTNVVDALEATYDAWAPLGAAPRIEHAQLMQPADMQRCAQLGIALSVQPAMLITDSTEADARWGPHRTPHAYAYRSMHDAGCRLLFGSDAPIEDLDPLAAIRAALHRDHDAHGPWHPEQRLDLDTAIGAATGWAPRAITDEQDAVLITGTTPAEWRIAGTRLGARWTFRAEQGH